MQFGMDLGLDQCHIVLDGDWGNPAVTGLDRSSRFWYRDHDSYIFATTWPIKMQFGTDIGLG